MPCCDTCACLGEPYPCLGESHPGLYPHFRRWCRSGTAAERMLVRDLSRMGTDGVRAAASGAATIPTAAPAPPGPRSTLDGIPLAGDVVEAVAKRIGAERLAKWYERKTGRDCGCASRRDALNRADAALRRYLAR